MPTRRDALRLAERIASAPTVSYREHEVLARIRDELDRIGISYASDRWGNLVARYRGRRPRGRPVAFTAHTDHPGFIILSCKNRRAEARWLGGVLPHYFKGTRVRVETADGPVRGKITGTILGPNKRVARIRILLDHEVVPDTIGGWDLIQYRLDRQWIRTKSADDLLGCAGVLYLMKSLSETRPPVEVWGVFTRAEEDGLLGATAMAEAAVLPKETAVVVLETSKELPCGRQGKGVIVRVGDRRSVYDPGVSQALQEAAEDLTKRLRTFHYQRCLMDGGVCEASTFQVFGYQAGGLALPLGNYHNMGKDRIREETVHQDDYWNLARLLPPAAERIALAKDGLAGLRKSFLSRLAKTRRELVATKALAPPPHSPGKARGKKLAGIALACILSAGLAEAVAESDAESEISANWGKPMRIGEQQKSIFQSESDPRELYDALHYDLKLQVDPQTERITGELTMRLRAVEDLTAVRIDLGETLTADSASCEWSACTFFRPNDDQIEISGRSILEKGDTATVTIRYSGTPGASFFSGFEFFTSHGAQADSFPVVSNLSQPDRAHGWWPCKDVISDKATIRMTLLTPHDYMVAGNGNLLAEVFDPDWKRTIWETSYPTSPYLVSFVATNFVHWRETYHAADGDSLPLFFYAYPEDEEAARIDFTVTHAALDAFESLFGPYPFRNREIGWEKLGVAEFPWGSAAMEHQTCISYGQGFITGTHSRDWALVHEISHQWWGDAITPTSMDHIWLNEGFASYCEALFFEAEGGVENYRKWMLSQRSSVSLEFRGTIVRPEQYFNATVYRKGSWTLHMLRGVLGDDLFFQALENYYDRYEHGNASTQDFMRAVEETAGEDLRWFFLPWLYGTGRPEIAWDWWHRPVAGRHEIDLFVQQVQADHPTYPEGTPTDHPPDHFAFPLEVRIFGDSDSLSQTVFVDRRTFRTRLDPIPFEPDRIELDPDHWILREIAPRGERIALKTIAAYPNPATGSVQLLIRVPGNGPARVTVHDVQGRTVRLLQTIEDAGIFDPVWDGRNDEGSRAASGIYFVRVDGPGVNAAVRVVLTR